MNFLEKATVLDREILAVLADHAQEKAAAAVEDSHQAASTAIQKAEPEPSIAAQVRAVIERAEAPTPRSMKVSQLYREAFEARNEARERTLSTFLKE